MARMTFGHVVNHRGPKGTKYILDAFEHIRKEMPRLPVGFIFAERLEHDRALMLYQLVDVMIEQVVIGWYGLQAVECMALGIPVMVYIDREDARACVAETMLKEMPVIEVDRWSILKTVKSLAEHPNILADHAVRGLAYVEKWHSAAKIAEKIQRDIGNISGRYY